MTSNKTFEIIKSNIKEISPELPDFKITRDSILCNLGLNSVDRAELIEKTLEDLNLNNSRFEFHVANNLGELADLFSEKALSKVD